MFCFDAAGKLLHVGRWNTFVSVFPIKRSEVDVVPLEEPPLDELPPEDEPPDTTPEPEPVLSIEPSGNVKVAPFVEKTILCSNELP